jgi:PDZ domain-containing protein
MLRRLLSPLRLLAAAAVVLGVAVVVLITHSSDHYLEIPDQAHPLARLVKVSGSSRRQDNGGIFYVDVLLKQASLLESLVPQLRPEGADIVNKSDIVEPGISEQQRFKLERADMKLSQLKASAVALRALGYRVPVQDGGLRVVAVTSDSHAIGLLQPGDVIVSADGRRVRDRTDLSAVLTSHRVGEVVRIGIRRGTKTRVIAIRTTSDVSDPARPIIGVLPIQALKVHFPFQISFDLGDVGGPQGRGDG